MQLPILSYGHPILQKKAPLVPEAGAVLNELIANLWDTMLGANGCGLAAPQVGLPLSVFIVDSKSTYQALDRRGRKRYFDKADEGIKATFINAQIINRSASTWSDDEGCLSFPGFVRPVSRSWSVTIKYQDETLRWHTRTFSGLTARMIQHEYDHVNGVLFIDLLAPPARLALERTLADITAGRVRVAYPMRFANQ